MLTRREDFAPHRSALPGVPLAVVGILLADPIASGGMVSMMGMHRFASSFERNAACVLEVIATAMVCGPMHAEVP